MAFINFEKGTGREYLTEKQIDEALSKHQEKKQKELVKSRRQYAAQSYSADNQWILPNVEKNLSTKSKCNDTQNYSSSSNDRIKKEFKKKSCGKKLSKRRNSSTTDSESDRRKKKKSKSKKKKKEKKRKRSSSSSSSESSDDSEDIDTKSDFRERDDWMALEHTIPTYKKEKTKNEKKESSIIATPGQSERELNPYWKDGGSGVPLNVKEYDMKMSVGDKGLEWYERALKRAQETALEEGRPLADVVCERWGSLQKLTDLITNAKAQKASSAGGRLHFQRPGCEFGRSTSNREEKPRTKSWIKNSHQRKDMSHFEKTKDSHPHGDDKSTSVDRSEIKTNITNSNSSESSNLPENKPIKILTDEELNALAAKLVKAEILGKTDQILKLKQALEEARTARQTAVDAAGTAQTAHDETVVLVQTGNKGATRPFQRPTLPEPSKGRRKKKNTETHQNGERVRYFHDDDQRDLKQMFEAEKFGTNDEDKALFLKLAVKHSGMDVEEDDAAFADAARVSESAGKKQQRDLQQAVQETNQRRRKLDTCHWCFGSAKQCKNLIVSLGKKCYLCLPETPLTPLHCQLVPLEHCISGTQLDEDVWEEIHDFRKSLVAMAKAFNQYVIFFEDARNFKTFPHLIMQCIMVDKKDGEMAPIYFKKALLDCEGEWAMNKKVVDIKGSDVRGTIPKGLPYFSVEFPPDSGFAHVIENEHQFPSNFAQSVIGGMLDLDHRLWRRSNKKNVTAMGQRERTIEFSRKFSKYDFTSRTNSSSSSSSSSSTSSDSD